MKPFAFAALGLSALLTLPIAAAPPALAAPRDAASPEAVQLNVVIGAQLKAKARRYGETEFGYLSTDLANTVRRAAAKGGFTRLDLVLEDARPNRPTFAMLSRNSSLSLQSVSVGGATVTGVAYGPAGAQPLTFSWYETNLRNEVGAATWSDAGRAFQFLASDLSRGRVPTRLGPGTPGPERPSSDPRDPWNSDN